MMVMAFRFRPKIPTIRGVIATRGTERSTIAMGMKADAADCHKLNEMAHSTAATVPAPKPRKASRGVVPDSLSNAVRLAAAWEELKVYRHTSSGVLPINEETWKALRKRSHAPITTARVTAADSTPRPMRKARRRHENPPVAVTAVATTSGAGS